MDAMDKLKSEYVESLPQKKDSIVIVVSAALRAIDDGEIPDWDNLKQLIHKFAGSSGTYGFKDISNHARNLENRIDDPNFTTLPPLTIKQEIGEWLEIFNSMIAEIIANQYQKAA